MSAQAGVWAPAFMSSLAYFDGYRSAVLPANLLQGQRDYFGAHTYQRTDQPRGQYFHVDWPDPKRPQLAIEKPEPGRTKPAKVAEAEPARK
jgi:6-phosphogluconate dehydrogenase